MERLKQIPKGPFYRIVTFDKSLLTLEEVNQRLLHVRKRLWKMQSYHQRDQRILGNTWDLREILYGPTIKKSLKNVKRLSFSQPADRLYSGFFRHISCAMGHLETLSIHSSYYCIPHELPFYQKINPKIQKCFLKFHLSRLKTEAFQILPKFKRFRKCVLYISKEKHDAGLAIKAARIKPASLPIYSDSFQDYFRVNPDCIEEIQTSMFPKDTPVNLPALLPNLKVLKLPTRGDYDSQTLRDFSFLEKYQALESLHLTFTFVETDTLDCLQSLSKLKSFHLVSHKGRDRKGPVRKVPILTGLEHLGLRLEQLYDPKTMFDMENVKEAILSNKNLKSLELGLDLEQMGEVLSADLSLKIDKLVITFLFYTHPPYTQAENIAAFLEKHSHIKSLEINFPGCYSGLNHLFFKPIGAIDCLEELKLNYAKAGGREDNEFEGMKDALTPNSRLTSFEFSMGTEGLGGPAFNSLIDPLMKLKHLQKFAIQGALKKITKASFVKFTKFIENARHLQRIDIALRGFAQEEADQINDLLGTKYSLSNKRNEYTFFFEY